MSFPRSVSLSILLAVAACCSAQAPAPSPTGTEFSGQFTVHGSSGTISGAPTQEAASLLANCRTGTDFHVLLSGMPNDLLEIELGFAELLNAQPGQRVFDVDINDKRALNAFDIAATAGGPERALIRRFTITPKRGYLDFHFSATSGEASVSYIRVRGKAFVETVAATADSAAISANEEAESLPTNLPTFNRETGEVMQDETSPTWPTGFPLGGIGTGKFEILPNGEFANLTTNNSWDLPVGRVPGTFIAIGTKSSSANGIGKLLRVRPAGASSGSYQNAKTFLSCVFKGIFPVAQWAFKDDKIPVQVTLEGWSPLVPQNVGDSSLPAAVLYVHLHNTRSFPVSAGVAFSWEDINGRGGSRTRGDQFGYAGSAVFSDAATSSVQGVLIRSTAPSDGRRGTFVGDYFIGTPVKRAVVTRQLYWDPRTADIPWWRSFTNRMRLEKVGPAPSSVAPGSGTMRGTRGPGAAVICATVNLAPKERRRIPFIVSWYVPKITTIQSGNLPSSTEQQDYATTFGSSLGVASYISKNRVRLQEGTTEWQSMVLRSNIPGWLKTHVLNSLSPIITDSILLQGGRYSTLESPGEMGGMMGALDHRLAAQPFLSAMYPSLDRSELELYAKAQSANGQIPRYVGNIHGGWTGLDPKLLGQNWADPTSAWVMQSAAQFTASGDKQFAETIRPALDKAMAYLEWSDTTGDKLPDGGSFFDDVSPGGSDSAFSAINYSSALGSAAKLYSGVGDTSSAEKSTQARAGISNAVAALLAPYASAGSGNTSSTFAALLAGDWAARAAGVAPSVDDAVASGVLNSLEQRHLKRFHPMLPMEVSADGSVVKGLTATAGLLQAYLGAEAIRLGAVDLGLGIFSRAEEIADRVQSSPWQQPLAATVPEGTKPRLRSHMSTPAAWSALGALSGAVLDIPSKTLFLDPKIPSEMSDHEITIPVFTPAFWAWLDYNSDDSTGTLAITKVFPGYESLEIERVVQRQTADGKMVGERRLTPAFAVKDGQLLRFAGWPNRQDGKITVENPDMKSNDTATTSSLSEDADSSASAVLSKDTGTSDTVTSETKYGP